jgi:hypothetical protein
VTTTVHLLTAGYAGDRVASSVTLVRDGDALIVADPGMVASRARILEPLGALGVAPDEVTRGRAEPRPRHCGPPVRATLRSARPERPGRPGHPALPDGLTAPRHSGDWTTAGPGSGTGSSADAVAGAPGCTSLPDRERSL